MDLDKFAALFPVTPNTQLCAMFDVCSSTVNRTARRMGLTKDVTYKSQAQASRMLGVKRTAETCERIRLKARGRRLSDVTKAKILATKRKNDSLLRGSRHPRWKGGHPWERFKDPRYQEWRKAVLERDGYVCQKCGRQCKKREKGLAAHHILEYAKHPTLRYDISNGKTMCRKCHMALHGRPVPDKTPIPCGCGCGTMIEPVDVYGRPRRFVNHHAARGRPKPESMKKKLSEQRTGKKLSEEHRLRISLGLRNSTKNIGRPRR